MNSKKIYDIARLSNIIFAFTCLFVILWFFLFALDKSPLILEIQLFSISYSFSVSGIFGILSAFTFGFFLSIKRRQEQSTLSKHLLFGLIMTVYLVLAYLIGLTLFSLFI